MTLVGLTAAWLLKEPCTRTPWNGFQYSRLCYNDIQPLFYVRGIDDGKVPYRDQLIEYPPITGGFMDLAGRGLRALEGAGLAENNDADYFKLSVLALSPFALATTMALRTRVSTRRLMLWAIGPPFFVYAFHNWDLLAVAGATWGLVELEKGRRGWGGAALGLGASAKLFPSFFLPGALADARFSEDRNWWRLLAGFAAAAIVANVPWMFVSFEGWMGIWTFHAGRYPDFGTVWYWLANAFRTFSDAPFWLVGNPGFRDFVSIASLLLFVAGGVLVLYRIFWTRRRRGAGAVAASSLGILAMFLLVSKVHSPQFALWVLPLLVLLRVPWWLVVWYMVADMTLFVSGFYWFTVFESSGPAWKGIFQAATFLRAGALAVMVVVAPRLERAYPKFYSHS